MNAISRSSKLKAVAPQAAEPRKPQMLWYGKAGVGKTMAALHWPTVYFIDSEGGANRTHYTDILTQSGGVYMGPSHGANSFDEVIEQVKALAKEQHGFRTLVIDSISHLYNASIADEVARLGDKDAFGASKKLAVQQTRQLLSWISKLDMNVVLIAHEKDVWGDSGKTGVTYDGYEKIEYALDLTLNIVKAGPRRLARVVKSRLQAFPEGDRFDWNFEEFADRYGRDVIERASRPIEVATPEQVDEIKRLLDVVKLPEGQAEKWLAAAGVSSWEEMEGEKIAKCIGALKARLVP